LINPHIKESFPQSSRSVTTTRGDRLRSRQQQPGRNALQRSWASGRRTRSSGLSQVQARRRSPHAARDHGARAPAHQRRACRRPGAGALPPSHAFPAPASDPCMAARRPAASRAWGAAATAAGRSSGGRCAEAGARAARGSGRRETRRGAVRGAAARAPGRPQRRRPLSSAAARTCRVEAAAGGVPAPHAARLPCRPRRRAG
jgi:hypothetical protein